MKSLGNVRTLGTALRSGHWPTGGAWLHSHREFYGVGAVQGAGSAGRDLTDNATQQSVVVALRLMVRCCWIVTSWACTGLEPNEPVCGSGLQLIAVLWAALSGHST